ncbi:hypothetical protein BKA67DRAFT_577257 [Truncatella angustata]|uniref:Transmembrane protein n=1 Tax=Truncatella angustata TaxID=152316 RepID=A0A9P8RPM7_9PEZI|nr:uncharacterized protein BKA67DRAFT_577257 [Truncatella angustata]KAH6647372.1 hypothetical protein BKA67DRAFT_577257 [Truncatella angustata]
MAARSESSTRSKPEQLPELPLVGNQPKWNRIKLILRSISLIFEIAVIGLAVPIKELYVIIPVLFAFLWDISEIISICVRRSLSKGIKAGAHVGCDLLLFMGCTVVTVFIVVSTWTYQRSWYDFRNTDYYADYRRSYLIMVASCPLLSLITLLHFTLFVRACVEVHRRRKDRRIQQLVMAMIASGQSPAEHLSSALKAGTAAIPLSDVEANRTPKETVTRKTYREEPEGSMSCQKEMPLAPEDLGMNEKVLLDDIIRQVRVELSR